MASRYLLHFAHEHVAFRWPEFLALTSKNGCKFNLISSVSHLRTRPYILIELEDGSGEISLVESAKESYMLKDLYELWAQSSSGIEDLAIKASCSKEFLDERGPHNQTDQTFRLSCGSFGNKLAQSTKISYMKRMFFVNEFKAKLDLKDAKQKYQIFEMNERTSSSSPVSLTEYYFCRHLTSSNRTEIDRFSLKNRVFIANTSMDPMFSFLAANMAQIEPNDFVYDPFVGSGSLLVAAAYKGAHVLGSDIDWMLLHGKSKPTRHTAMKRQAGEGVLANLRQYDLECLYIDVVVADISRQTMRSDFSIDSIITDPPYGIRESSEKIGKRRERRQQDISISNSDTNRVRYPSKVTCDMSELLGDLLNFSATHLRVGGRLVYYLPVTFASDEQKFEDFIPTHTGLRLVAYSDQALTKKSHRLMVTMEKLDQSELLGIAEQPRALCDMNSREVAQNLERLD